VLLQNILQDLESYLNYKIDEGVQTVELSPDVMKALGKDTEAPLLEKVPAGTERSVVPIHQSVLGPDLPTRASTSKTGVEGISAERELKQIAKAIVSCTKCFLYETRTKTVPGQGSSNPEIMFVGEAPGYDEDQQGLAFVGAAGQLLTKMIQAMGYTREEVFIGNILKCRPPSNRTPMPDEMATCLPYLKAQITILKPKVIIALGATAVRGLLDVSTGITRLRGTWLSFEGIDLMPTYHPAYLLRNPSAKKDVWKDLQAVLKHLGRKPPMRKRSEVRDRKSA